MNRRRRVASVAPVLLSSLTLPLIVGAAGASAPRTRTVDATYVGTVGPLPDGAKDVSVWVPLPFDTPDQKVTGVAVDAPFPSTTSKDSAGNLVAHFTVADATALAGKELVVKVRFRVERREVLSRVDGPTVSIAVAPGAAEPYLAGYRLVPLTPRVKELARSLAGETTDPIEKARRFYGYLVTNGTYDKTTPGWGRGDSERFCDVKKGNCTDFHSLFLALARSEGIPARFRMGFPLKPEKEGSIPGYHCWAEFFVAGKGWIPVDASDAAKSTDPARRAYLFGNLDPDRLEVSGGRDLTLSPAQKDGPVNFLIAPYVEVDGKAFGKTAIKLEYRDV